MDSDNGTGDESSEVEEIYVFRCRKCPGKTFTVAEKESHRAYHRTLKAQENERNGIQGERRTRRRIPEPPSTNVSDITLFEPLDQEQYASSRGRKRTSDGSQGSPPPAKRRSRKWYNRSLTGNWKKGTGA